MAREDVFVLRSQGTPGCWPTENTFGSKDLDPLDNSGERKEMQIGANFGLLVRVQRTLSFRAKSFIVITPFVSPTMRFTPANGANSRSPTFLRL